MSNVIRCAFSSSKYSKTCYSVLLGGAYDALRAALVAVASRVSTWRCVFSLVQMSLINENTRCEDWPRGLHNYALSSLEFRVYYYR